MYPPHRSSLQAQENFSNNLGDSGEHPSEFYDSDQWKSLSEAAQESAKFYCEDIKKVELDFAKQLPMLMKKNTNLDDSKINSLMSQKGAKPLSKRDLEKWEDALSDDLQYAKNALRRSGINPDSDLDATAEYLQDMIFANSEEALNNTVEAQAGQFYRERATALSEAIKASGNNECQKDLEYIARFPGVVAKHLGFKYMSKRKYDEDYAYNPAIYETSRTNSHNDVIKHLNGLNNLAQKYGTRPFTPRNFWSSNIRSVAEQTPAMSAVLRYDRDIVEEYYFNVFPDLVEEKVRAKEQKDRYDKR